MHRQKLWAAVLGTAFVIVAAGCGSDEATAPVSSAVTAATDVAPSTSAGTTSLPATTATPTTVPAPAATDPTTTGPAAAVARDSLRDVRYCEVLLVGVPADALVADVWNTMGQSDCPLDAWAELDPAAIAAERGAVLALLNGPRYWTLDEIEATMQNTAPVTEFGTIGMFLAATVELGVGLPDARPYVERAVDRDTVFRFFAGSEIYELTDPFGQVYVMQSYSAQTDPTMTIDRLAGLGSALQLPEGWTYASRVLDADLDVLSTDDVAVVIRDDFANTYQRIDAPVA